MAFGSGAGTRAAYVVEVTPGTTPTTPSFETMRVTSSTMRPNKVTGTSRERQEDRNVRDEFQLAQNAGGSYPFELNYSVQDELLESALFGTWVSDVLVNGITRKYVTLEEKVELGATDSYHRYPMSMVNQFELDIQAGQVITGSFEFFSQKLELATSAIAGATYAAPNSTIPLTAAAAFAELDVMGGLLATPRRIQLRVNNNLRRRPVLGSLYSLEYGEGVCDVTGMAEFYFESNAVYQSILSHGGGALTFQLGVTSGSKYQIDLPAVRWLDGAAETRGRDDDIIVNAPFRARYDTDEECSIMITRGVT